MSSEQAQKSPIILLVDANSIINRSYFALAGRSDLTAPDGTPTGAVNTYLNTVSKYISEIEPTHILSLFDRREKTFRHDMFDGYKATRKPMDPDLAAQMPIIKEIMDAMQTARYDFAGYEADDLIGTYSRIASEQGFRVFILSGDKDDFQLINERVSIIMPVSKAGKSKTDIYDSDAFYERYGFYPEDFVTYKALMGDSSDNIPGVKGVGEKTAAELVKAYHSLDAIYDHVSELSASVQKRLIDGKENAYLSYRLSEIDLNVPVTMDIEKTRVKEPDRAELALMFHRLGLKSQIKKFKLEQDVREAVLSTSPEENDASDSGERPFRAPQINEVKRLTSDVIQSEWISQSDYLALRPASWKSLDSGAHQAVIIAAFSDERIFYIEESDFLKVLEKLASMGVGTKTCPVAAFSIKNQFKFLPFVLPFEHVHDIELAGYLLNQIEGASPTLELLFERSLKIPYPEPAFLQDESDSRKSDQTAIEEWFSSQDDSSNSRDEVIRKSAYEAAIILAVASEQRSAIRSIGIEKLAYEIEMPLIACLDRMERSGFLVDRNVLLSLHNEFQDRLTVLEQEIYALADGPFNILSPKQLGEVLFIKLKLPSGRKNAGGQLSTDSDELARLEKAHPIVPMITEYRQLSKLDSTFVVGLQKVIDPKDGRIHSKFSQAMTTTGRLSSSDPNLQNIPIRTSAGSAIRKAFVAAEDSVLIDADYSQIELRLLAHLSEDQKMIEAFKSNEDIHVNTASSIFNVPKSEVLPYMRSAAKTVNFSIVYGISDFGLSQDLGISIQEAHRYIAHYYEIYPQIKSYLESLKTFGKNNGYVQTVFGRRRVLKELSSSNHNVRQFGERAAMNTPIQGTAADIIKIAMTRVCKALQDCVPTAHMILQVHDELIIECKREDQDSVAEMLKEIMEGAVSLKVPLIADVHIGQNWFDCKG